MADTTELERLAVRLVGQGSDYERVLDEAVAQTEQAAKKIEALTETEMAQQNASMEEAARITQAVATPTERYAQELQRLESLYKSGYLSQETYNRALEQARSALPSVRAAQAAYNAELRRARTLTESVQTPTEKYRVKLAEVERLYRQGMVSSAAYNRVVANLQKEFVQGSYAVQAFGRQITSVGRSMRMFGMISTMAITVPVVGMIRSYAKFGSEMTKSTAIVSGVTADLRKEMEATAESIARNSVTSADELAKSYFYLISAGMNLKQSIAALPVVEKFAVAGAFDMAEATTLLADAQAALGLKSADAQQNMRGMLEVSDALVKANVLANANVQQFSEALTNDAGAAIKTFDLDLNESIAILAIYADQGLKGAEAGSMFGRMIRLLIRAINEHSAVFRKMNIDTSEFASTGKNIKGVIEGITSAVMGMGPAQKAAALEALGFQARIQQAILPLLGTTDKIRGYEQELKKAGGTTQEVAEKQLAPLSSQMIMVWHRVQEVSKSIGEYLSPYVRMLGQYVSGATEYWRKMNDESKKTIAIVIGLTAVIGPLSFALGGLAIVIGLVTTATGTLMAGFAVIGTLATQIAFVATVFGSMFLLTRKGFRDFVNDIKLGSLTIGERFRISSTLVWQTWDWTLHKMKVSWRFWKSGVLSLGKDAYSGLEQLDKEYTEKASIWDRVRTLNFTHGLKQRHDIALVETAKNLMQELRTPLEVFNDKVAELNDMWDAGYLNLEEYNRALGRYKGELTAATEAMDKLGTSAKMVAEAVRTPLEVFNDKVAELKEMLNLGKIDQETYNRAMVKYRQELTDTVHITADFSNTLSNLSESEESLESFIQSLRTPLEVFGDNVAALNEMWDAGKIGIDTYNRALGKYVDELKNASKATDELTSSADALTESLRTPLEVFGDNVAALNEMWDAGKIGIDTYNRAIVKYTDELRASVDKANKFPDIIENSFNTGPVNNFNDSLNTQINLFDKLYGKALTGKKQFMAFGEPGSWWSKNAGIHAAPIQNMGMPTFAAPTFSVPTFGTPAFSAPTFAAPMFAAPGAMVARPNGGSTNMRESQDWGEVLNYLRAIAINTGRGVPAVAT